jgi:hypothetical protein
VSRRREAASGAAIIAADPKRSRAARFRAARQSRHRELTDYLLILVIEVAYPQAVELENERHARGGFGNEHEQMDRGRDIRPCCGRARLAWRTRSSGVATAGNQIPCDATPTATFEPSDRSRRSRLRRSARQRRRARPRRQPRQVRTHTPTATPTDARYGHAGTADRAAPRALLRPGMRANVKPRTRVPAMARAVAVHCGWSYSEPRRWRWVAERYWPACVGDSRIDAAMARCKRNKARRRK